MAGRSRDARRELRGPQSTRRAGRACLRDSREESTRPPVGESIDPGYTARASSPYPAFLFEPHRARSRPTTGSASRVRGRAGRSGGGGHRDRPAARRRSRSGRDRDRPAASVGRRTPVRVGVSRPWRPRDTRGTASACRDGRGPLACGALCAGAGEAGEPADMLAHLRADTASHPGKADWVERALARGTRSRTIVELEERWEARAAAPGPGARGRGADVAKVRAWPHPRAGWRRRFTVMPLRWPASDRRGSARSDRAARGCHRRRAPGGAGDRGASCRAAPRRPRDAAEAMESASVRRGSARPRDGCASSAPIAPGRRGAGTCSLRHAGGSVPGRGAWTRCWARRADRDSASPPLRRREQDSEERYLFHVCVSRPTETPYLSWRSCDEEGIPPPARHSSTRCWT